MDINNKNTEVKILPELFTFTFTGISLYDKKKLEGNLIELGEKFYIIPKDSNMLFIAYWYGDYEVSYDSLCIKVLGEELSFSYFKSNFPRLIEPSLFNDFAGDR